MGIMRKGLLGNHSGKIGNLVFYELGGRQVVRTLGRNTKPATAGQLQNRNELTAVMQFLKPLREFVNLGFAVSAKGSSKSAYNMAVSYNKVNAVSGTHPDVVMDYAKVLVTKGNMPVVDTPAASVTATGLAFTWTCPAKLEWPRPNDQVMLLAYFPGLQKAEFVIYGVARQECAAHLALAAELQDKHMEVYISFIAEDRKQVADSVYLGRFNHDEAN